MFSSPRTTREGYQPTRSPKLLSLFLLVLTALIAGFVTPLTSTTPAQAANPATPVTQTLYIVYVTRNAVSGTEQDKTKFIPKEYLDMLIKKVSDYWNTQTNGGITEYKYNWDDVKVLQLPAQYPMWDLSSHAGDDYYGLSSALFSGVQMGISPATQILSIVDWEDTFEPGVPSTTADGIATGNKGGQSLAGSGALRIRVYKPPVGETEDDWSGQFAAMLAHELGHNLGLYHAFVANCPGNEYDWPTPNKACTFGQRDGGDIMGLSGLISTGRKLPYTPAMPPLSAFRRSELGVLGPNGRKDVSDYYSGDITLTNLSAMDFDSLNEVRVTDPSDPTAVYSIEYLGRGVRVLRILTYTDSQTNQRMLTKETAVLQPTRFSDGTKDTYMQVGDSFTSASGFISFSVETKDDNRAVIRLNVTPVISLNVKSITAAPGGNISNGVMITSGTSWEVTAPDWIRIPTPKGTGNQYEIVGFAPNLTGQQRSGTITVTAGEVSETIDVTQDPVVLTVSQTDMAFSPKGASLPVVITANADWTVSIPSNASNWLTSDTWSRLNLWSTTSQTIKLTAKENNTGAMRSADVKISQASSGLSRTIKVSQGFLDCGATVSSYCPWDDVSKPIDGVIDNPGDKDWYRFVVPSTGTWNFTSSGSLGDSYGTIYESDGKTIVAFDDNSAGNGQFLIRAFLTAGKAYFLEVRGYNAFYTGMFTVTATSFKPTLTVSQSSWNSPSEGGTQVIQITSNTTWEVSAPSWVTVSPKQGTGNGPITLKTSINIGSQQSGVVTVKTTSGSSDVSRPISVSQSSYNLLLALPGGFDSRVPAGGGSKTIVVSSNTSWEASADPSLVTFSAKSGTGEGTVIFTVAPNTTGKARTVTVTVATTKGTPVMSIPVNFTQDSMPVPVECGDSASSPCVWSNVSAPVTGMIDPGGDKDWYKFTVPSSGTWTFKASVPASGGLRDSYGTLYASDGKTVIAANDDGAGNLQFAVTASLVAKQTYYLEVKGWSSVYLGAFTVTATKS